MQNDMSASENTDWLPMMPIKLEPGEPQPNVYCVECAKGNPNIRCTTCPRHFHDACVKDHRGTDWMCMRCTADSNMQIDIKFIPNILDSITADDQLTVLRNIQFNTEQAQYPIDIPQMIGKSYETFEQFEDDLKWFHHNCRTIHGHDRKIQAAIKQLIQCVNSQMEDIEACGECYENACKYGFKKSLEMTCAQPHLLIWAKVENYGCYWPAKVMAIDVEQHTAIIRFFGDCAKQIVSPNHCYIYSKKHPKKKAGIRKSDKMAIKDANKYIENIRLKFGRYNFAKHRVTFAPEKMPEYLEQMVAENPSADFDGNESIASETSVNQMEADFEVGETAKTYQNRVQKRSAPSSSASAASTKKIRSESEVDAILDTMESNFKDFAERETRRLKHDIGQHLQNRLDEMNDAKHALEQTIDTLNAEKGDLGRDNVDLEKQLRDEKAKKLASEQKIAALEETHRQEKASLEAKIAVLELKKNEVNCTHCQVVLQQVTFCNSECVKKHYANCQ